METQRQQNRYADLRISDCSSDEENASTGTNKNSRASGETASVYISWSSDEELGNENCQGVLNRSCITQKSITPGSAKCTKSARKAKLPNLCVKRKLNKEVETPPQVRRTSSCLTVPLKDKTNANRSPWCKVRKTFATLRQQSSLPTIDTLAPRKEITPTKTRSLSQKSDGNSIEWSSSSSESGSPTRPTHDGTPTTQKSTAPTELELLVALIEREQSANKMPDRRPVNVKHKRKRLLQGGYAERLQKLEEANRIERNFLQHDQQMGLQYGTRMRVVQLDRAYGVQLATVELEQGDKSLAMNNADTETVTRIIIDADMATHVKVGSKLEAFFDTNTKPYIIGKSDGAYKDMIYVQPHKLLLL